MAAESFKEQQGLLAEWEARLPGVVSEARGNEPSEVSFGERHGSWILSIAWHQADMLRIAELAITNPEAVPDDQTDAVAIEVRASATTDERFVVEKPYESRRSVKRIPDDFLALRLATAVRRAAAFTPQNLQQTYVTGGGLDESLDV